MFKHILRIESATDADAGRLADIRVKAMQPSLQAAGRFDPERAKNRFLDSFRASETKIIYVNEKIAGFFVVQINTDHLYLNHLYITDDFQGSGIGRQIIDGSKDRSSNGFIADTSDGINWKSGKRVLSIMRI